MNFLVMVNVNLLWAVNVESEMLPMKLKSIVKHQRLLKGEVRKAFFPLKDINCMYVTKCHYGLYTMHLK